MLRNFRTLAGDEAGFVITAELVLVLTIAVLAMVAGGPACAIAIEPSSTPAHATSARRRRMSPPFRFSRP